MSTSGHVIDDLGAYVLGTLSGEEERDVRVHLESCALCRRELTRIQGAAELLDSAKLAEEPPPDLEDRILRAAGHDPGVRRRRRRRLLTMLWTVLLAAAFFTSGYMMGRLRPVATGPDQVVELRGPGSARGEARLFVLPTTSRRIELTVEGMPALPPGAAWAVWFQDKQEQRRSAGSFYTANDGRARVTLTVGAGSAEYTAIAITRTDADAAAPPTLAGTLQP